MHILVTLKQVHDPNTVRSALRIAPDGRDLLLPAGATPILNGYDANALEEALRLREASGGTVSVLSVGPAACTQVLRRAIAMGADQAVQVEGPAGLSADGHSIARLLAAAVRRLDPPDLILAGRAASDTDGGIVALLLAGHLGLPGLSPVRAIRSSAPGTWSVDRICEGGLCRLQVAGPAVLCVSSEINTPRSPSLKGVMAGKRAHIRCLSPAELGCSAVAPALELLALSTPATPVIELEQITGASAGERGRALADRLYQEGLI